MGKLNVEKLQVFIECINNLDTKATIVLQHLIKEQDGCERTNRKGNPQTDNKALGKTRTCSWG